MSLREINIGSYGNRFTGYTELRLQRNSNLRIALLNGDVVANAKSVDSGVSARANQNGAWGFASRPELDPDAVVATLEEAQKNADLLARHAPRPDVRLPVAKTHKESDFATTKVRKTPSQ